MPDRRKLALAAKAVVAVALLAVLVENGSLDFSLLIRVVTDPVLAVGTPLVWGLAYVVFAGARWHGLVRAIGGELTYLRACRDVLVNHFFNTTTPVGIAGDLWRVVATDPDRARWPVVAGALGVERLSGLAAILTVGGALVAARAGVAAAVVVVAGVFLAAAGLARARVTFGPFARWVPLEVQRALGGAGIVALAWSFAQVALAVGWIAVIAGRIAPVDSARDVAEAGALALVLSVLPVTPPGGIGVGHAAMAALLAPVGYAHGADVYNLFVLPMLSLNLLGGIAWALRRSERAAA